jgi:hypothetical protein
MFKAISIVAAIGMMSLVATPSANASAPIACPPNVSPACISWQDTNTTTPVQDIELFDHNGSPIWWVNNTGGMWVGNDKLGITGASVFDQAAYLWSPDGTNGALVLSGQTLTASDISMLHSMERAKVTFSDLVWLSKHGR